MTGEPPCQSKIVSIRTILNPAFVVGRIRDFCDESAIAWVTHYGTDVEHSHIMVRFPSVRRWKWLRDWFDENGDPHNRTVAGDSWRRGVRYLLHLDNPEKHEVPRADLHTYNIDDDDLSQLLAGRASLILPSLRDALSMSPYDAFSFLVERRGFRPSECTSAINLLLALQRAKTSRGDFAVTSSGPESYDEKLDRLDDEQFELDEFDDIALTRARDRPVL